VGVTNYARPRCRLGGGERGPSGPSDRRCVSHSEALLERARKMFPTAGFTQAYGMTELSPVATLLTPADHDDPTLRRSAGRAAPLWAAAARKAAARPRPSRERRGGFRPSRRLQRSSIPPRSVLWCNHFRARGHPATTQWISARPARHPTRATGGLANRPGHDLELGIDSRSRIRQCSPTSGSVSSLPRVSAIPPQRHADRAPLGSATEGHYLANWPFHGDLYVLGLVGRGACAMPSCEPPITISSISPPSHRPESTVL
jgi:acyl-CoA synthetase (AMP-forming)/AMP-acid ligase II